jgi:hypothetical protein
MFLGPYQATVVADGNSVWNEAAYVACGDVNRDGYPDIVGVLQNKRDLSVYLGGSNPRAHAGHDVGQSESDHQPAPADELDECERLGTSEAAFSSDLGWCVRDLTTGSYLKAVSYTLGALFMEVISAGWNRSTDGPHRVRRIGPAFDQRRDEDGGTTTWARSAPSRWRLPTSR